jgi:uncharacterized protein YndB with AHSA1/START domain
MDPQPVIHDTFVLERRYPAAAERVFSYFSDPAKKRRWFADSDMNTVEVFDLDCRVGGAERTLYRMGPATPFPGVALATEGVIQEIAPSRRIVTATTMSLGERRISSALVTIEIAPDGDGATLRCTHQAAFYEGADGPAMRQDGWRKLLDRLGQALAN